jgi:hypothetical protein
MHRLELSSEDAYVLREALISYLSDLRMEIADTDRQDYREQLKHRKGILEGIAGKLAPSG